MLKLRYIILPPVYFYLGVMLAKALANSVQLPV